MKRHAWWCAVPVLAMLPGCGKALELVYDRCEKGDMASCERVRGMAEKPCQRSEAKACFMLGELLTAGKGGAPDAARGRDYLDQACERGYQPACKPVATAPASGPVADAPVALPQADAGAPPPAPVVAPTGAIKKPKPVAKTGGVDRARAEAACRGGDPQACINLGKMIRSNPTAKDKAAAQNLIRRACAGKNAETCNQIRKELLSR
jgi:uncharacterized protein